MKVIIGIIVGIFISVLIDKIKKYLKRNHLKLDLVNCYAFVITFVAIIYLTYSGVGIISSTHNENGNICKGFNYGIQICSGDINE